MNIFNRLTNQAKEDDIILFDKAPHKPLEWALKKVLTDDTIITFDIETAPVRAFTGSWDDAPNPAVIYGNAILKVSPL